MVTSKVRMGCTIISYKPWDTVCGLKRAIVKGKYASARAAQEACLKGQTRAKLRYFNGRSEYRKG